MGFVWAEEELVLEVLSEREIPLDRQQDEPEGCQLMEKKPQTWKRGVTYCEPFNLTTSYLEFLNEPCSL